MTCLDALVDRSEYPVTNATEEAKVTETTPSRPTSTSRISAAGARLVTHDSPIILGGPA